jgi:hypothetical protein
MRYPKGHEFEYRPLRPSQINVDRSYQRAIDHPRVAKIVKEFDGDIFNEPKVSYRDGRYWVFDGQNSIAAWKALHKQEDKPLLCKVYRGMTWLDEALAFCKQNGFDKDVSINDKLRAGQSMHDPDVLAMIKGAELNGYVVDFTNRKSPTRIKATAMLARSYRTLGYDLYLDMLTAIKEAWYGDADAVSNQVLKGLTGFYKDYGGHFKRTDLVDRLKKVQPAQIIRNGKAVPRGNGYEKEILAIYNKGRSRHRLGDK